MTVERFEDHMESVYENISNIIRWTNDKSLITDLVLNQAKLFEEYIYDGAYTFNTDQIHHLLRVNSNLCLCLLEQIKED